MDDNPNSTADYAVMSGTISGSAGIIKTGNGLLKLTATNSYTGTTTIAGGILQATIGTGIPSNGFISLDGGVLQFNSAIVLHPKPRHQRSDRSNGRPAAAASRPAAPR